MENTLLTVMISGFTLVLCVSVYTLTRIDKLEERLSERINKLSDKTDAIDQRLCRIEGAISAKDCCILKHDDKSKKAQ